MIRYFFSACLLVLTCKPVVTKPIAVSFNGSKWLFPITVGEATKRYSLSFKPPGYYYVEMKNGSVVHLMYAYKSGSFFNEHQSKETLYNSEIESYIHTFPDRSGLLDSLRQVLEMQFNKKMVACVDTQRFGSKNMPISLKNSLPAGGAIPYQLMHVDSSLVIGLRHKPSLSKAKQTVEVYLFYNVVQEKIKTRMISF